jgi:hypothetical protein
MYHVGKCSKAVALSLSLSLPLVSYLPVPLSFHALYSFPVPCVVSPRFHNSAVCFFVCFLSSFLLGIPSSPPSFATSPKLASFFFLLPRCTSHRSSVVFSFPAQLSVMWEQEYGMYTSPNAFVAIHTIYRFLSCFVFSP